MTKNGDSLYKSYDVKIQNIFFVPNRAPIKQKVSFLFCVSNVLAYLCRLNSKNVAKDECH